MKQTFESCSTGIVSAMFLVLTASCSGGSHSNRETISCAPAQAPKDALECKVQGYTFHLLVEGKDSTDPFLFVYHNDLPLFSALGNSRTLWDRGLPIVEIEDRSGDGVFDNLTYDVRSKASSAYTTVIDLGFDGQADIRVDADSSTKEFSHQVWVEDAWYERLVSEGHVASVDGVPRPYELRNGRYTFAERP